MKLASINCITALRITIMGIAGEKVIADAAIVMNHSAMIVMMLACSNGIKTKVFPQTKIAAAL